MKVLTRMTRPWRAAILGIVLTGTLACSAYAAVSDLTIDPTAELSPGHLHATLTGTITCDPGDVLSITGQIVQPKGASGFGSTNAVCDGTPQAFAIDVSGGPFPFPIGGAFKKGKASAQVSTVSCDPVTWTCTTRYTDAMIRLR